jgi:hypothetical protein
VGVSEVVADDVNGLAEHVGGLLGRHSAEVTHFDQTRERLVLNGQFLDGIVQLDEIEQFQPFSGHYFETRRPVVAAFGEGGSLQAGAGTRVVD